MAMKVITDETPNDSLARAKTVAHWLDFSVATLWRKAEKGDFPKPIKLFEHTTAWRVGDVRQWLKQQAAQA